VTDLFIGRAVDAATGKTGPENLLLDSTDLTTHGLIVGMTGSGKTALGIVLIEELLKAGVPVLAIDPKGDLGNLLLQFPALSKEEFEPWVDTRGGLTAEGEAAKWQKGLSQWGLFALDVDMAKSSRDATIYTPGSTAGTPLDLLGSLRPPGKGADEEDRRDLIGAFLAGLLGLAGIEADPVKSREFILLSLSVESLWAKGETATLEALLKAVATPSFASVGALPLETFFPAKERQALVLTLNNLLASPSTAAFRSGAPLDMDVLLAPRKLSIVSIAHLSDAERVFVVATLLSRVKAWMRSQSGSSTLRAVVFIDEIFGFFPPSAEPATKRPLLTLLKQARAFGVGVVLATQNPVDLDYKGLANCGCWFVGTLQTERDRKRLADGLTDAGGSVDVAALLDKTRKRVFLLHDIHRKAPCLVESRWAMSYLRGPMTRGEISKLSGAPSGAAAGGGAASAPTPDADTAPPPTPVVWPARWAETRGADFARPHLYVKYAVRYRLEKATTPEINGVKLIPLGAASAGEVMEGEPLDIAVDALKDVAPSKRLRYEPLPPWLGPDAVRLVEKAVRERLPDKLAAKLLRDPVTGALSTADESPEAFATRVAGQAEAPAKLRERLEKKRRDLAAALDAEKGREQEKWVSAGGAAIDFLGGLLGKRKSLKVGKMGGVLTKNRMEKSAEAKVETLKAEIAELEAKIAPPDPSRFETVEIVPSKTHVDVLSIGVAWVA